MKNEKIIWNDFEKSNNINNNIKDVVSSDDSKEINEKCIKGNYTKLIEASSLSGKLPFRESNYKYYPFSEGDSGFILL